MRLFFTQRAKRYINVLSHDKPEARADIRGSGAYADLIGTARFYQTTDGVLVSTEVTGLPQGEGSCGGGVFGYHLHEGEACTGTAEDPFADATGHYNPIGCKHPYHAGDMPPLFGAGGRAFSVFLTNRFRVQDIVGRTVVIHGMPDDFTSQPSGNSGKKIACGVIRR